MENRIYDNKKAEKIITYVHYYPDKFFTSLTIPRDTILYRTKKGNWFTVHNEGCEKQVAEVKTEDEVKEIFTDLNEVELYNKYFGKLEEA